MRVAPNRAPRANALECVGRQLNKASVDLNEALYRYQIETLHFLPPDNSRMRCGGASVALRAVGAVC